jgi:hypothetical protein
VSSAGVQVHTDVYLLAVDIAIDSVQFEDTFLGHFSTLISIMLGPSRCSFCVNATLPIFNLNYFILQDNYVILKLLSRLQVFQ